MSAVTAKGTAKGTADPKRVALAASVGATIEWYDFFLYGTAAALVFSPLFFPQVSPAVGLIASFATYAVGFLARPLGALVGGYVGDRIGRKAMLVASLLIMGIATTLIGVLPTYQQVGIVAPLLLLVLRLAQGFGVGGEWGGAALMTVESAPPGKRGLYGSFTQIGVSGGMLLAVGVFTLTRVSMNSEAFLSYGWRIPFLLSAVMVIVGLLIRAKLAEPESFQKLKDEGALPDNPLKEVVKSESRSIWLTMGMRMSQNTVYYLYTTFGIVYIAQSINSDSNIGLYSVLIASAIGLVSVPLWAALSDRVGRRPVYLFGTVTSAIFITPFFLLADTGNPVLIVLAMVVGLNLFHDAMYGPQAAFFSELFSTRVRYSGASIGYQFGSVLAGGFAPLIAISLLAANDGRPWYIVGYFVALSAVTFIAAYLAPETNNDNSVVSVEAPGPATRAASPVA